MKKGEAEFEFSADGPGMAVLRGTMCCQILGLTFWNFKISIVMP